MATIEDTHAGPLASDNPLVLRRRLEDRYRRYYDSVYAIADEWLARERQELLAREGLATDVLLEPLPGFESSGLTFTQLARELGLGRDVETFLSPLLGDRHLHAHQAAAVRAYLEGRNVVVAAGTGSGKTEAVLLPILIYLLQESRGWSGRGARPTPWWENGTKPIPQREGEEGRPAGVRALLLYPMNALVEDQMVRLRRILDGPGQTEWLDRERRGHRFYFGRYTGQTPYRDRDVRQALEDYARRARQADEADRQAAATTAGPTPIELRPYVPHPLGAEMLSRPDMQAHPPDLLITNYSMLSIMLGRSEEDPIFAITAEYLRQPEARFHLVVDELHGYRGTAGTEVAMLLRRLLHRLELQPDSSKLRVLGASASLGDDDESARRYLEELFGLSRTTFALLHGFPRRLDAIDPELPAAVVPRLEQAGAAELGDHDVPTASTEELSRLASKARLALHLAAAARDDRGRIVPTRSELVAARLAPRATAEEATRVLTGLLTALTAADVVHRLPVRAHLLFTAVAGVWACTRPDCPEVPEEFRSPARNVGRLYTRPRIRCDCGARCLDLWICQSCGEHLLGGFASRGNGGRLYLLPELPELERVPDQVFADRTYGRYRVLWPRSPEYEPQDTRWVGGGITFAWMARRLHPPAGEVEPVATIKANAWLFTMSGQPEGRTDDVPAIPTRCPNCGSNWERPRKRLEGSNGPDQVLDIRSPQRMLSPLIRGRVHPDRAVHILTEALLETIYPNPRDQRLVVFSDSRQGAARLNAELDLRHYEDSVRQLVSRFLAERAREAEEVRRFRQLLDDPARAAEQAEFMRRLRQRSQAARALLAAREPWATHEDWERAERLYQREASGAAAFTEICERTFQELLAVGRNPGGLMAGMDDWMKLIDWSEHPPQPHPDADPWMVRAIRGALSERVAAALFERSGRDVESLGLGVVVPDFRQVSLPEMVPEEVGRQIVMGTLRLLGIGGYFPDRREGRDPHENPPQILQRWYAKVEEHLGLTRGSLSRWARESLPQPDQICHRWIVQMERCLVAQPPQKCWRCDRCGHRHAHSNAGTCLHCRHPLPVTSNSAPSLDDYFTRRAREGTPVTRLHTEELTGQTQRDEAVSRQARFQGVFLGQEPPLPSGIDVLCVTTTMEAGVDIGSLRAVLMANVPPMRFNYQQRVGRAGRRADALSVALTLARDRSHDQYYFQHPEEMTTLPPPPPYLATDRVEIIRRVVVAEALRAAFASLEGQVGFDGGVNVHGHFGAADNWPTYRERVLAALERDRARLLEFCRTLLHRTRAEARGIEAEHLLAQALNDLPGIIDRVAQGGGPPDLSQRLAERGHLPMFGFPSQVRYLFTCEPRSSYPWPPRGAVDRDLRIAVSEFAPGNEVVVDKRVHRVAGCVAYRPLSLGRPQVLDPLGEVREVGLCDVCRSVDEQPGDRCRNCGATGGDFRRARLASPAGFRTDWTGGRPYEGSTDRLSRASVPRLTLRTSDLDTHETAGLVVWGGSTQLYTINDNGGRGFVFPHKSLDREGRIALDGPAPDSGQTNGASHLVLGGQVTTDVLLARAVQPAGGGWSHCWINVGKASELVSTARRAAWTSLAFAFRAAAALVLDIEVQEIDVGLRLVREAGPLQPQIFLADAIENGAGYATHLAVPANFERLLAKVDQLLEEWSDRGRHACDTACYSCLKDHTNASYHPLLDWRLAADAMEIARHGAPRLDRWSTTRAQAVRAATETFGWTCDDPEAPEPLIDAGTRRIRVVHPLADHDRELREPGREEILCDVFNLDRRPGEIYLAACRPAEREVPPAEHLP
ncbi:MAG TPA: DEAD/DEAH box helicase [Candidatus Dormibacteraeota bacterium]|nr:DEAD/DEAH box helicase [Candidatus Dormibacteraeota bacterium]